MKRALITGITGQDGSYLAELLLEKGYEVYGLVRRSSSFNTARIDHLYTDPHEPGKLHLRYGDLSDATSLMSVLAEVQPDEVYNLGGQSHVRVSFDQPVYTADIDALGCLRLLEHVHHAPVGGQKHVPERGLIRARPLVEADASEPLRQLPFDICRASFNGFHFARVAHRLDTHSHSCHTFQSSHAAISRVATQTITRTSFCFDRVVIITTPPYGSAQSTTAAQSPCPRSVHSSGSGPQAVRRRSPGLVGSRSRSR